MCTPADESMQFLELLLGSAPISTENTSIIEDVFVDHNFSLLESTEQLSVQNERNAETSRNYKQDYIKILRCLEEKNKEYDRIRRCLEEKNKDHDQLKQQYIKLGQDYAELHYESKRNALDAIKANTNFEKITEELQISQCKMVAMENQYSVANTLHKAALSNNNQLSKYVEKLESDAANFKDTKQSYIETIKEEKRNNSTLKYKIKTYEEDLCSLAGKLDHATDKKSRDRETQRQITKYTKKKFNADLENIDSESVDTGRGSSFSNYSPAYSINFSPLNMTENFEQKMMNDASTSPLQTNGTYNLSKLLTSPRIELQTKPLENKSVYVDSLKENIKTVDTASSPISFVDDMKKITTVDTASSPISFVEDMAKTKLTDIALSSFSGIRSPVARAEMIGLDCSPKLMDIAISPIYVTNPSCLEPMSPLDSTASPIEFTPLKSADVTIPTIEITDITRPLEPTAVRSPAQTPDITRPIKPAAVTSPVVPTIATTRPFKPAAVTRPVVLTTETTRPFKPAALISPVVQTQKMTRPLQSADVVERSTDKSSLGPTVAPRLTAKTPEMTMQLKPVTKYADLLTGPSDINDSLTIKISEMARPIETTDSVIQEAKTTTSEHVISLVNNNISVISKTPDLSQLISTSNVRRSVIQTPSRPTKHADARRPLIENKTLDETKQYGNIKIFSSEKSITERFREIRSHIAQDQERDDLEVRMILNKFRLDWNALSPISITPDLDEEGLDLSKSDVRNDETERQSLEHPRSQISKEPDSLLVITPDSKKLTITQNKSNILKHKINDDNPSHFKNKVPMLHSIPPIRHTPVDNENERQSDKTMHLIKREAPVKIYEKNTKSSNKIDIPQSLSELASNMNSLESKSDLDNIRYSKLNNLSNTSRFHLSESQESIKKEYLLKEKQVDSIVSKPSEKRRSKREISTIPIAQSKTNSVPQTQTKLQSSPVDNMPISKEPLSNTRKPPENHKSERIKSTFIAANSKTKSITQSQIKLQSSPIDDISISKEPQFNTREPPERRRSERIQSTIPAAQSKTKSITQTQMKLQSSLIDDMSISKVPQSNMREPPKRRRSERIQSTIPEAQSNTESITQTQMNLQSSPIDDMSISKEPQSNTREPPERRRSERIQSTIPAAQSKTKSITQTQMTLQSSPIGNMSISKEPQSNTRRPPERRRSDRIKCTISTEHSKTVPQTETKLQLNPIGNMSISKEPQSNTRSGCPPVIANPEYGRKRTTCRSMEAQSANENSKRQKNSECYTSKCNSAEICSEAKFTYSYSKPPKERISRVKASISSNTESVPNNNQSESISDRKATENIDKDLSYTPASKRAKLADDKTDFLIKLGQNINENNNTKMSITHESTNTKNNNPEANLNSKTTSVTTCTTYQNNNLMAVSQLELSQKEHGRYCADYKDIDIFNTHNNNIITHTNKINQKGTYEWTNNLLDKMIYQYGSKRNDKQNPSSNNKEYEDQIAKEIENAVARCVNVSANPIKYYETLQKAVHELKTHSDILKITGGLFKYLKSSDRKAEFLPGNKNRNYHLKPTPTKYVVSLMQIIDSIDKNGLKIWEPALNTCRYLLFNLDRNANPSLDVVESVTHLFVNMCQYNGRRNARYVFLFMLAAMYCANYKAIIIVKHCLDLVPEILPYEHETEKTLYSMKPLLQTFIFLLYFYNCNDQFGKVQDLRFTLKRRYGYDPTKDNDTTILYMLKQTIMKIKDHYLDIDILEYCLLILAKRKNTMWCHKNIVQKILLPIIKGEIYASKAAFPFCLRVITKLLRPYNNEMAVHTVEVVNLLMNIIKQPHPQELKEDIICGLMSTNIKNITDRINSFLANWNPPRISPKFEEALKKYIERKPMRHWRQAQAINCEHSTH